MEILTKSREFSKKELFKIANDKHILLKDVPDETVLQVYDYVRYITDDGKEISVFWHMDKETGECATVATTSPTVVKKCESAFEFMNDYKLDFKLKRSKSKGGRTYMDFELV